MLVIDGSQGEGGGQILRSSLALSLLTKTPFRIEKIRGGRRRPGLLRQHLTAVQAAAEVSGATVEGAVIGSTALRFAPGEVKAGTYAFAIGSAGSTSLVFQTVLPALALAAGPSTVELRGGTHNPFAPPFDFLIHALFPLLSRMGVTIEGQLHRHGFYPAGGGHVTYRVTPTQRLMPLALETRGVIRRREIAAQVSVVATDIGTREVRAIAAALDWDGTPAQVHRVENAMGPGNVVTVVIESEEVTEVFTGFGEKGLAAEHVAAGVVREVKTYLAAEVPVGQYLADQLLLWLAIAGGGCFRTVEPTEHTRTHCDVIGSFLDVDVEIVKEDAAWRVRVSRRRTKS